MVEARVRRLPGYVERVELMRQKGPAYRLRQYASKVLSDLHHPYQVLCQHHPSGKGSISFIPIRCQIRATLSQGTAKFCSVGL